MHIDLRVEVVDEGVEDDIEVEFAAVAGVLEDVNSVVVCDQCCNCD